MKTLKTVLSGIALFGAIFVFAGSTALAVYSFSEAAEAIKTATK